MLQSKPMLDLPKRPRRNRLSPAIRSAVREKRVHVSQLVYPLFVHEDEKDEPIASLPGQTRWSVAGLAKEVERCRSFGLDKFILFPKVPPRKKTRGCEEAWNPKGLIPGALRALRVAHGDAVCLMTDVALDPYNEDGHDGLVDERGRIGNDASVQALVKQALMQAEAGADVVAPSDMMDGRIGAIREALDANGFTDVLILAYTAKYASGFYGPFRGALDSAPNLRKESTATQVAVPGDKLTYQMDPANAREALRELMLDESEGADWVMVKPAGPYLDVIAAVRANTTLPVAAYQVSGEYLMLKSVAQAGWLDERAVVMESITGIVRAGADIVLTYYAPEVAGWLGGNR
jgi:porphobilinogen synthase